MRLEERKDGGVGCLIEAGYNISSYFVQRHVHENCCVAARTECPVEAATVDCSFKFNPVCCINRRAWGMDPDTKTIANEALEKT